MSTQEPTPRRVSEATRLRRVKRAVVELQGAACAAEQEFGAQIERVAPAMRDSARNLVHYLAVRRHDVRTLQDDLTRLGLSSLGRMEAHVLASLQAVLRALCALENEPIPANTLTDPPISFDSGTARLAAHTDAILGAAPQGRETRIMVTMPGEAADDPDLIRGLLDGGMGVMRINCAHDSPVVWERMVEHLRQAERDSGKRCIVSFDLAGPKLRTGPVAPGPSVVKWRPERDALGRVVEAARVRLVDDRIPPESWRQGAVPVGAALIEKARPDDTFAFEDARQRSRTLRVIEVQSGECLCETDKTAYVVPRTRLALRRDELPIAEGEIGMLPALEQWIPLRAGDVLEVAHGDAPGRGAIRDESGQVTEPAFISCALAEVFSSARAGEPILFDDGKVKGVIRDVAAGRLRVEITGAAGGTARLKSEKGINLPESHLALPALTAKDIEDLAFVAKHGDAVAMSFVQQPRDIEELLRELEKLDASRLGVVLKIETKAAFGRLPDLLLSGMQHPPMAVMIARGDLGVEVGFERLSEVQEEILWLCEAAHVPVIWATQVLESLAKGGLPSRAEVSDAAMGSRAECVMLNKGPYILETLGFLTDVLERIEEHHHKKTARLRKLRVAGQDAREPKRAR
jgi:pyruvate kinase